MLRADYKIKLGSFTAVEHHADGVHTYPICIYGGNALAAFINHYTDGDGKKCAYLYAFFADKKHMRNIEKNEHNPFFDIKGAVKLNMAYKQSDTLLGFFARQGHTIKPYYKQPKK